MSTDSEFYEYYLKDLSYIQSPKWTKFVPHKEMIAFIKPTLKCVAFVYHMVMHILLSLLTDVTFPISQPYNFMLMILCIPFVILILFPVHIVVKVLKLFQNKREPNIFDRKGWEKLLAKGSDIDNIVQNGRMALTSQVTICEPKIYNLELVETLLILSTIIYGQDSRKVRDIYSELKSYDDDSYSTFAKKCHDAHKYIHEQAETFGLEFRPLSELDCLDSLFAGMFWSKSNQDDFIVVTFKGTTPTNFIEWLSDFLFIRTDASQFVFGEIHKGFYENFFSKKLDDNKASYPAQRMVEAIRQKANEIYQRNGKEKKVNIWVTGHSLGAALAQVFYARLVKSNDFPNYCVLRDAFVFAGPAVGDKDFASSFNGNLNQRFDENRTLWRIVNTNDIVTKMPPQHLFNNLRQYITKNDILNYFSIGYEVHLFLNNKKPEGIILREKNKVINKKINEKLTWDVLKKKLKQDNEDNEDDGSILKMLRNFLNLGKNPIPSYDNYDKHHSKDSIYPFEFLMPDFFRNHLTHRYFMAIERLKSEKVVPVVGCL